MNLRLNWKKEMKFLLLAFSFILLLGCGGSSSSDSSNSTPTAAPDPDGIWHGTFTEYGQGTYDVDVLTYNGEMTAISSDANVIYKGFYSVTGNTITGTVNAYNIGGGLFATSSVTLTFTEQGSMNGSFASSYGSTGEINVTFDNIYNRSSSLSLTAGDWVYTEPGYIANLNINSQGEISGTNSDGCLVTGVVSLLDSNHNVYVIDADATQCGSLNGSYDGFAILTDDNNLNDSLVYCVSSSNYIMFYTLSRQ